MMFFSRDPVSDCQCPNVSTFCCCSNLVTALPSPPTLLLVEAQVLVVQGVSEKVLLVQDVSEFLVQDVADPILVLLVQAASEAVKMVQVVHQKRRVDVLELVL